MLELRDLIAPLGVLGPEEAQDDGFDDGDSIVPSEEAGRLLDALFHRLAAAVPPGFHSWARACRPDLLEKIDAAEDAVNAAAKEAGGQEALGRVREAVKNLEKAWRRALAEWPVARVVRLYQEGKITLILKPGISETETKAFKEWVEMLSLSVPAEIQRAPENPPPPQPGKAKRIAGQLLLFPGAGFGVSESRSPQESREEFRSPWQDWLERVEIVRVSDLPTWRAALEEARQAGTCGLDTETTGLDPLQNRVRLVQLAVPIFSECEKRLVAEDGRAPEPGGGARAYVLDLFPLPEQDRREALEELAGLMADKAVVKVGHNLKFDLAFLRAALGRWLAVERLFDTMLASQLCTAGDFVPGGQWEKWCTYHGLVPAKNDRGQELKAKRLDAHGHLVEFEHDNAKEIKPFYPTHSLAQIAHRHLEVQLAKEHQASDWCGELSEEQIRYAALDAAVLLPLREILARLLAANGMVKIAKIEFACLPAVAEVELAGMPFDASRARKLLQAAEEDTKQHRETLATLARGAGFRPRPKKSAAKKPAAVGGLNPDSAADVLECLRLLAQAEGALAGEKLVAGGEEFDFESRDETLARLAARLPEGSGLRRFAEGLRAYRAAKKRADFLRKWLESLHPADDRLHPDLRQINPQGVGRFSASNPNLQQAPRGSEIRALFRAPAGRRLVVADYSAIEMRIMAQLSGDKTMRQAFLEGVDIHRFTAGRTAGKNPEEVTKDERQAAKSFNFGLIYGMQASTLRQYAETSYGVNLTIKEAEAAHEAFFRAYPAIAAWHRRQDRRGYEDGFEAFHRHDWARGYYVEKRPSVRTLAGRLRVWPVVERDRRDGGGSYLRKVGSFTELYNSPDQGSGADLIKLAMGLLYRMLLRRGWEDVWLTATVHDELVLEASKDLAGEAAVVLKEVMLEAGRRLLKDVPVEVEVTTADSWADK